MTKRMTCIKGGKIVLENRVLLDKVLIFDDKIIDIINNEDFEKTGHHQNSIVIDAHGNFVSPGFIDLHIHGAGGSDAMDGTLADLKVICEAIAKNGVTCFLPTTMTMEKEKIYQALDVISAAMKAEWLGAKVLGAHMEGPFLSPVFSGAHDRNNFLKPDSRFIQDYIDTIKIITIAPEEDAQFEFIHHIQEASDIVIAMGHTNADYETAMEAIRHGVSHVTHLFNAMPSLHHRAPGPVGAVLNSQISFEIIADTLHIHPALFQILLNTKGKDKMILVTDSMRAAGMGEGVWELGGQSVIVDKNSARRPDGVLAGSITGMNQAVFNILKHTNLEIFEAVDLASLNPAKLIHIDKSKGSIEIGKDADIILFDDELNVNLTILNGRVIYSGFGLVEA